MKTLNPLFYPQQKAAQLHSAKNKLHDQDMMPPDRPDAITQGKNLTLP